MTSIVLAVSLQLWMQTKTVAQRRRRQSLLFSPVKYAELWNLACEMLILCSASILSMFLTTFKNGMRDRGLQIYQIFGCLLNSSMHPCQ